MFKVNLKKWKKYKRSGTYRRKLNQNYSSLLATVDTCLQAQTNRPTVQAVSCSGLDSHLQASHLNTESDGSAHLFFTENRCDEDFYEKQSIVSDDSNDNTENAFGNIVKDSEFRAHVAKWALEYNIPHIALKDLFSILNKRVQFVLPKDPRTLLMTNTLDVKIISVDSGKYWHNGLIRGLKERLANINNVPNEIFLNINIDGLPVYNSSKLQFWPILCNIFEIPSFSVFVIGIYAGQSKPTDLDGYLSNFVNEMKDLENGLVINDKQGNQKTIQVKLRAFLCDSPARALIKGVCNFNGKHGCLKCTVLGEYSHRTHTVIFSRVGCPKRNDEDFRLKKYGLHHKYDSPLLQLPIDMVEDFPVGDALHLIDLGIMKRLLTGWRDGSFGTYITKWCARDIEKVSQFLLSCKLPKEIHRKMRALNVLPYWKGSEYRCFLYYLSFIILKDVLCGEAYHHFLTFFCAITICSNEEYFVFFRLAERPLFFFIEHFRDLYGEEYMTSNIHNLSHIIDEVKKFGKLQSFYTYPFENKLGQIKQLMRQGNNPLAQIAKRLNEKNTIELDAMRVMNDSDKTIPYVKVCRSKDGPIPVLFHGSFILSPQLQNKWFLTSKNDVVEIISITSGEEGLICLKGFCINDVEDVFETPVKSSLFNIYKCATNVSKQEKNYQLSHIKCKLVVIEYISEYYFVPLLHTL